MKKKRLAVWFFCCCVFFSFSRSETRSVVRWLTIFQVNRVLRAITISHTVPHLIQQQNNRCKGSNGCRGEYALQVFFSLCRSAWWIRTLIAFYTLGGWDAFRTNNNNKTVLHFVVKFYLIFSFFFIRPRSMDFFSTASHNLIRKSFIFFFFFAMSPGVSYPPPPFFYYYFHLSRQEEESIPMYAYTSGRGLFLFQVGVCFLKYYLMAMNCFNFLNFKFYSYTK